MLQPLEAKLASVVTEATALDWLPEAYIEVFAEIAHVIPSASR